jgi:hypothetical protein
MARLQRGAKWQPGGGLIGLGTSPCSRIGCTPVFSQRALGTADNSACV